MSFWTRLSLSALTQCIITAGTALIVAGSTGTLTNTAWVLAAAGGLVAAAKDVQAYLAEPPK